MNKKEKKEIIDFLQPFQEKGQLVLTIGVNTLFVDVEWSYKFDGGKKERTRLINQLNKYGFIYNPSASVYIKK